MKIVKIFLEEKLVEGLNKAEEGGFVTSRRRGGNLNVEYSFQWCVKLQYLYSE